MDPRFLHETGCPALAHPYAPICTLVLKGTQMSSVGGAPAGSRLLI